MLPAQVSPSVICSRGGAAAITCRGVAADRPLRRICKLAVTCPTGDASSIVTDRRREELRRVNRSTTAWSPLRGSAPLRPPAKVTSDVFIPSRQECREIEPTRNPLRLGPANDCVNLRKVRTGSLDTPIFAATECDRMWPVICRRSFLPSLSSSLFGARSRVGDRQGGKRKTKRRRHDR